MDQDPDHGPGTPERKRTGIGKYLKRIRSAIRPSNSHKGAKHDDASEAGPAAGRHLESAASFVTTYTYRTKTPEHRNRTPEHRNRTPELAIRTKSPSVGRRTPSLRTTTPDVPPIPEEIPPLPQQRPPLPDTSVSEGSLVARPVRDFARNIKDSPLTRNPEATLERSNSNVFPRSDPRDERSIALFDRYGIQLQPGDWAPANRPATMERVDKEIRMRVHYHCHKCEVALGPSKICISCGHKQCKKCVRFPVRKHKHSHHHDHGRESSRNNSSLGRSSQMSERSERAPLLPPTSRGSPGAGGDGMFPPNEKVQNEKELAQPLPDYETNYVDPGGEIGLAISTSPGVQTPWPPTFAAKSSRSDRLSLLLSKIHSAHYRPPSAIRINRICHLCAAPFVHTERTCFQCDHELCQKCPRDPPRPTNDDTSHAPSSGSGSVLAPKQQRQVRPERMWKKPRMRIRYTCDECGSLFNEREKICDRCGHQRCENCARTPAMKVLESPIRSPSPVVIKSLETRLATFAIIDAGAANRTLSANTVPAPLSSSPPPRSSPPRVSTPHPRTSPFRASSPFPVSPSHAPSSYAAAPPPLPSPPRNNPCLAHLFIAARDEETLKNRHRTPEPAI